jgi:hypothetical protein
MDKLEKHQKVLGLGLSKTGTTSLAEALNTLGIKTIHYPWDQSTYEDLKKGNYKLSILNTYQGITDITIAPYYAQLDKAYPRSKFILTVREVGSWLRSVGTHWSTPTKITGIYREYTDYIRACVYGTSEFNEDRFRYVYELHCRNVSEYFAHRQGDLLIMNIYEGDGWEKLCPFLGLPIPNLPFPHLNKKGDKEKWINWLNTAINEISAIIPTGNYFVLVDDSKLGLDGEVTNGLHAIPFLRQCMQIGEPSVDGATAVRQLERLRQTGLGFIVFAWPAFWWFEYYSDFHKYLRSNFRSLLENDRVIIFDLRKKLME